MGPRYPPPTLSRLEPLGADLGGPRSIGGATGPRAGNLVLPTVAPGRRAEVPQGEVGGVLPVDLVQG